VSTEELRNAFLHYRELFASLLAVEPDRREAAEADRGARTEFRR
jgi:hypothetical protein